MNIYLKKNAKMALIDHHNALISFCTEFLCPLIKSSKIFR